jgi:hypothetical protein
MLEFARETVGGRPNIGSFLDPRFRMALPVIAAVALAVVPSSSFAFGGAIHDAAALGGKGKVQALLKSDPTLIFNRDKAGEIPLHIAAFTVAGTWQNYCWRIRPSRCPG